MYSQNKVEKADLNGMELWQVYYNHPGACSSLSQVPVAARAAVSNRNGNGNTAFQNLWDIAKAVLREV